MGSTAQPLNGYDAGIPERKDIMTEEERGTAFRNMADIYNALLDAYGSMADKNTPKAKRVLKAISLAETEYRRLLPP